MKLQKYGFSRKYAIMKLDFFEDYEKSLEASYSEAHGFHVLMLYSFTNFKVLTALSDFTVTKYTPLFKPSRLSAVIPLAC